MLSLLLQREGYEELAEKCIFVAGHKASTCNIWQAFPWEGVSSTWPMKGTVWNLEPVTMWDFRVRWSRRMWPLLQFKCFVLPVPGSLCNLLWQVTTDRLAIPFSHPAETWGMRLNRYLWCLCSLTVPAAPNSQDQITRVCCILMILDWLAILRCLFYRTPRIKLVMPTLVHCQNKSALVVKAVLR